MEKLKLEISGKQDFSNNIRLFLAGEKGSGRTEFALTAPDVLFLAAYPGYSSLAKHPGTPYITIQGEQTLRLTAKAIKEGFIAPKTVVIDTINEVQRRLFLQRLRDEGRSNLNFDDWNWISATLNSIIKGFADLDINLIIISDVKFTEDNQIRPAVQGSFATDVMNYVDYAGYVTKRGYPLEEVLQIEDHEEVSLVTNITYTEPKILFRPSVGVQWPFNHITNDTEQDLPPVGSFGDLEELHTISVPEAPDPLELIFADLEDNPEKIIPPGMPLAEQINLLMKNTIKNESE